MAERRENQGEGAVEPFKMGNCGREDCFVWTTTGKRNCQTNRVTYAIKCLGENCARKARARDMVALCRRAWGRNSKIRDDSYGFLPQLYDASEIQIERTETDLLER